MSKELKLTTIELKLILLNKMRTYLTLLHCYSFSRNEVSTL